ncbi:spermatogenesis-associated protein 2-like protein isoform X4 [Falco naumanni]|uniref:spermatogenesis-associated protein 2-like protein isoform X4 n=1 Tax=Falco naumanni TaxID=148594 RepID=UPI001ADE987A|nr:spermatogenesis-associated protein 2-like protein isoform X4 [Falco naumanni]
MAVQWLWQYPGHGSVPAVAMQWMRRCPSQGGAVAVVASWPWQHPSRGTVVAVSVSLRRCWRCAVQVPDRGGGVLPDVPAERPVLRGVPAVRRQRGTLSPPPTARMCAGSALRQECGQLYRQQYRQQYRRCLERALRQGQAGACSDASLGERLRQRLRREPALLAALQEDAPAMLAGALRGRGDPGPALRGLARAFALLELAAANLYLFPWRREFGAVQTFSGAYVHLLRPALPEADLVRSFARLGYRRDGHRLVISRLPPAPELLAAACGFFACRLECEILAEVVLRLQPRRLRAEELLEARRLAGDLEACVEMLQQLGTQSQAAANCGDGVDLYREMPASSEDSEGEDAAPPVLWRDPGNPRGAGDVPGRGWDRCGDGELGQEPVSSASNPEPDTSSHLYLDQELSRAGSPLSALATGSQEPQTPGEPQDLPPAAPQEAPELPCYQLHSCLRQGVLPSYCCTTCRQLHTGACAAGQACRTRHHGQELRSKRQQRLWLQRTEVDMLLAEGSRPWS